MHKIINKAALILGLSYSGETTMGRLLRSIEDIISVSIGEYCCAKRQKESHKHLYNGQLVNEDKLVSDQISNSCRNEFMNWAEHFLKKENLKEENKLQIKAHLNIVYEQMVDEHIQYNEPAKGYNYLSKQHLTPECKTVLVEKITDKTYNELLDSRLREDEFLDIVKFITLLLKDECISDKVKEKIKNRMSEKADCYFNKPYICFMGEGMIDLVKTDRFMPEIANQNFPNDGFASRTEILEAMTDMISPEEKSKMENKILIHYIEAVKKDLSDKWNKFIPNMDNPAKLYTQMQSIYKKGTYPHINDDSYRFIFEDAIEKYFQDYIKDYLRKKLTYVNRDISIRLINGVMHVDDGLKEQKNAKKARLDKCKQYISALQYDAWIHHIETGKSMEECESIIKADSDKKKEYLEKFSAWQPKKTKLMTKPEQKTLILMPELPTIRRKYGDMLPGEFLALQTSWVMDLVKLAKHSTEECKDIV